MRDGNCQVHTKIRVLQKNAANKEETWHNGFKVTYSNTSKAMFSIYPLVEWYLKRVQCLRYHDNIGGQHNTLFNSSSVYYFEVPFDIWRFRKPPCLGGVSQLRNKAEELPLNMLYALMAHTLNASYTPLRCSFHKSKVSNAEHEHQFSKASKN